MSVTNFLNVIHEIDAHTIVTAQTIEPGAAEFRVGMGPFPARIRIGLDPRNAHAPTAKILLDVVVAELHSSAGVVEAWAAVPQQAVTEVLLDHVIPQPHLGLGAGHPATVQITYAADPLAFNRDEALGMLSLGALYAALMARELWPNMVPQCQRECAVFGLQPGQPLEDPRLLLRATPGEQWAAWAA